MTERPIAGSGPGWQPVAGNAIRLVDFLKLGMMDAVQTRDLVADVRALPLVYLGVVSHASEGHPDDRAEAPYVMAWTDLAIVAGQIDWIVAHLLDPGQRMRFRTLRASTLALSEEQQS